MMESMKMKKVAVICSAIAMLGLAGTVNAAGDAAAGKAKAASCAGCHGANGISNAPNYPNLAGQKEAYLAKAMGDYKSGARKDPTMSAMAAPLNDADIANLAAYFASLK